MPYYNKICKRELIKITSIGERQIKKYPFFDEFQFITNFAGIRSKN